MRTITITEGLSELKLLDARIQKNIRSAKWCEGCKNDVATDEWKKEQETKYNADWNSVNDLIEERNRIKSAIVRSNATQTVVIAGQTMTVAEAIERKSSIQYKKMLRDTMLSRFTGAHDAVVNANNTVQRRIDATLQSLVSSGTEHVDEAQKAIMDNYMKTNGFQLINPLDVEQKVLALTAEIDDFEKNVDVALSLNNATTFIEV